MNSASTTDRPQLRAQHREAIRARHRRAAISAAASAVVYGQRTSNCTLTTPNCHSKNNSRFHHCNQQYSVIALTDGIGAIEERYAYSGYGEPVFTNASGTVFSDSAKDNRYTYTGREWDEELSLYHFRARMYDAQSGRFCGRGPIRFLGSKWNLFQYVGNKPLVKNDPLGLHESPHDLHAQLLARLRSMAATVNSTPCLAGVTGTSDLLDSLISTANQISIDHGWPGYGGAASYQQGLNVIWVPGIGLQDVADFTIFHEMIHALDDQNDWFLDLWRNLERAEALAYAAGFLFDRYADLQLLMGQWNNTDYECYFYEQSWNNIFSQFDRPNFTVDWTTLGIPRSRPGTTADILIAEELLGLNFSAENISRCFPDRHCTHANYCELPVVNTLHEMLAIEL